MRPDTARRFALVIDEDATRLAVMKSAIEHIAFDTEVFLVDLPEGRAAISFVQNVLAHPGPRRCVVVLVRAQPNSWATAAMLAAIRSQRNHDQVDVVVTAEGRPDMLPVLITDFPALRIVSPDSHPCSVVAGLIEGRFDYAQPAS